MAGRRLKKREDMPLEGRRYVELGVLSASFLLGGLGGFAFSLLGGDRPELHDYLLRCFQAAALGEGTSVPLWSVVWEMIRWPLAAAALGLTVLGVVGVPVLLAARGFLLSYAAATFARLFGLPGLAAELAVFGVTALLAVPVLFVVSLDAFSAARRRLSIFSEEREGGGRLYALAPCGAALVLTVALQSVVTPVLFSVVCARLFPV